MVHHSIRLYPFDTEENDEEEVALNESIRVSAMAVPPALVSDAALSRT
jgi:hypothetical protein